MVMIICRSAWRVACRISAPCDSVLIGTTMAPMRVIASQVIMKAGLLGKIMPMREPLPTPAASSCRARIAERASASP